MRCRLAEEVERFARVSRKRQGALMAERGRGLARGLLRLGAFGARDGGEDFGGRFRLGNAEPRYGAACDPRVLGGKGEHRFSHQPLDAVALFEREAVAVPPAACHHLARNLHGDLLG